MSLVSFVLRKSLVALRLESVLISKFSIYENLDFKMTAWNRVAIGNVGNHGLFQVIQSYFD